MKQKDEERIFCVKFITLLQITASVVYKFNKGMSLKKHKILHYFANKNNENVKYIISES